MTSHRASVTLPAGRFLLNDTFPDVFPHTSCPVINFQDYISVFYTVSHFVPLVPCLPVSTKEASVRKMAWVGKGHPLPGCHLFVPLSLCLLPGLRKVRAARNLRDYVLSVNTSLLTDPSCHGHMLCSIMAIYLALSSEQEHWPVECPATVKSMPVMGSRWGSLKPRDTRTILLSRQKQRKVSVFVC